MKNFKLYNRLFGWLSFLVAATTYLLTIEPTTSLWDCGEFIASAYKLQVGHPPGAPLFMILARFFTLFSGDPANAAMMVNAMSALASAFTIMFLFWTITHLLRKILLTDEESYTTGRLIAVIGAGLTGAMAYTFSDTFWFSAVEGEVYASSSLFTAVVFWAILKWENIADQKHSNRWIILIAYVIGLSIGVHLLNLLAIPAIVFVYYFRKYNMSKKGIVVSLLISVILLASIMYGIIPGIVTMASKFELLFVNGLGLPFKSGVIFFAILLIASLILGIIYTQYKTTSSLMLSIVFSLAFLFMGIPLIGGNWFLALILTGIVFGLVYSYGKEHRELLNTILIGFTVIILGYSSYSMIVIRSLANPPMDENNPETVFKLLSYLNREQYGDRPLFYGHTYDAPVEEVVEGKKVYNIMNGRYVVTDRKNQYKYDDRFMMLFPRMYSNNPDHIEVYNEWGNVKGRKIQVQGRNNQTETRIKPTFGENLRFFFTYQIGHMYLRYFMWNFAGRQNDIQSTGGITKGNWLSGINFIDSKFLGPQENLPEDVKNHKARNTYYLLPFILGLIGLFYHYSKHHKDFSVVMLLFILTGLAIVVYLNQTPNQPRERDYAYAGSFYAFAIWIGIGVAALYEKLSKIAPAPLSAIIVSAASLALVPGIMATENWDDHDRSGRYLARDIASNYLNSTTENAILFTNGDNDTFPLWYAQEVEGIRTDARVCNLMLLNMDWYVEQMSRKAYESEPLPFSLKYEDYVEGRRDVVYVMDRIDRYVNIKEIIDFVKSEDDKTRIKTPGGDVFDFIPTRKFYMDVNKKNAIESGLVAEEDSSLIPDRIQWEIKGNHLTKSDLMVLDILANFDWKRPVYFASLGHSGTLGLNNYMQLDGFAYRLVPIKTPGNSIMNYGRIDTDIMYNNLMDEFSWGGMNETDVYLDHFHIRTLSVLRLRHTFTRLAAQLREENAPQKAKEVLDRIMELTPHAKVPYDFFVNGIIEEYAKLGEIDAADEITKEFLMIIDDHLQYYLDLPQKFIKGADFETKVNMQYLNDLAGIASQYKLPSSTLAEEIMNENRAKFMQTFGRRGR